MDTVIHMPARAGVRPSMAQPALYYDVNVTGTLRLLELARERGIRRFLFDSSSSVYGNNRDVPFSAAHRLDSPISPYAASKRAGELLGYDPQWGFRDGIRAFVDWLEGEGRLRGP